MHFGNANIDVTVNGYNKLINLSPFGELRFRFSMEYIFYLRISNLWKFFPIVFLKFHRSSAIGDSSNSDSFPF